MRVKQNMMKKRAGYIVSFIAMAAATLFVIYTAFVFRISRDAFVMTNTIFGIAMLVFNLALMTGILFSGYEDTQVTRSFTMMTISAFLSTVCSLFTYEAYALAEHSEFVRVMYILAFCAGSMHYGFFWNYIRALDSRRETKVWDRIVWSVLLLYNLLLIADIFLGVAYESEGGIVSQSLSSVIFECLIWAILYTTSFVYLFRASLSKSEKWALLCSLICPIAISAILYLINWFGISLPLGCMEDFSLTISLYLAFFYVYQQRSRRLLIQEKELAQSKLNTTILQANPHFVYNTLGSIEYFCDTDPETAKKMLNDFTKYLRSNSANLTNRPLIPFREELENLNAYLRIEMVRFPNLIVEYSIDAENFSVPCLSIQPLVENAIKHGVGKRDGEEGTVTVRTAETPDFWQIVIEDDGIGYSGTPRDGRAHIGIENVRQRLAFLCGGTLTVTGTKGQGTVAEIRIPKEKRGGLS